MAGQLSGQEALAVLYLRLQSDRRRWFQRSYGSDRQFVGSAQLEELPGDVQAIVFEADKVENVACFCLVGGVRDVFTGNPHIPPSEYHLSNLESAYKDALGLLVEAIDPDKAEQGEIAVVNWNDAKDRTVDEVIELVGRAADLLVDEVPF